MRQNYRNSELRECSDCGSEFRPESPLQRYCDDSCAQATVDYLEDIDCTEHAEYVEHVADTGDVGHLRAMLEYRAGRVKP